jgi:hypothetical protein
MLRGQASDVQRNRSTWTAKMSAHPAMFIATIAGLSSIIAPRQGMR